MEAARRDGITPKGVHAAVTAEQAVQLGSNSGLPTIRQRRSIWAVGTCAVAPIAFANNRIAAAWNELARKRTATWFMDSWYTRISNTLGSSSVPPLMTTA